MPAKPKKPTVPTEAEAEVADRIWTAMTGMDSGVMEGVSSQIASTLRSLNDVGATVHLIRTEHPRLLEAYATDLISVVQRSLPVDEDEAAMLVMSLLGSTTLARMLADAANGNIAPVVSTPRKRAPRRESDKDDSDSSTAEVRGNDSENDDFADDDYGDDYGDAVVPGDFDEPAAAAAATPPDAPAASAQATVTTPVPEPAAAAATVPVVPVPETVPVGPKATIPVGEDDF